MKNVGVIRKFERLGEPLGGRIIQRSIQSRRRIGPVRRFDRSIRRPLLINVWTHRSSRGTLGKTASDVLGSFGGNMGKYLIGGVAGLLSMAATANAQTMTSGFGSRTDPFNGQRATHSGVDIAAAQGTPVYATGDGYIGRSGWHGGYGNLVEVNHGNGYQTRFGHLSRRYVESGQYVRKGALVGLIGSTGRSTGPHLHYEIRYNGVALDPTPYIRGMRGTVRSHNVGMGGPAGR